MNQRDPNTFHGHVSKSLTFGHFTYISMHVLLQVISISLLELIRLLTHLFQFRLDLKKDWNKPWFLSLNFLFSSVFLRVKHFLLEKRVRICFLSYFLKSAMSLSFVLET